MNRIETIFQNKGKKLATFITGGDPNIVSTKKYIKAMIDSGSDIIEIGIPFSDPIAEGPVIQSASIRALKENTTISKLLTMVNEIRQENKKTPILFMTYLNQVFYYGYDKFFSDCKKNGIDGVIIPDAPFEEMGEIIFKAKHNGIATVLLVAPTTSPDRLKKIVTTSSGFIYLVSSMGVTGMRRDINTDISHIVSEIKKYTKTPVCVGFGISDAKQAKLMASNSDGVIIGSAIVKIIEKHKDKAEEQISQFVKEIKDELNKE